MNDELWYGKKTGTIPESTSINSSTESTNEKLSEIWQKYKFGSWIWIQDNGTNSMSTKIQEGFDFDFKDLENLRDMKRVKGCHQFYFNGNSSLTNNDANNINKHLNKIKKIQGGKWIKTEEICGLDDKRKWSITEAQKKDLKLFCAKPKA